MEDFFFAWEKSWANSDGEVYLVLETEVDTFIMSSKIVLIRIDPMFLRFLPQFILRFA